MQDVDGFLEGLKQATQQTKENPPGDESAPRVTEIAQARANGAAGLTFLLQSLRLLGDDLLYGINRTWYMEYHTSQILMRGILDAFVEGLGRFPELATPNVRCAALGIISRLAPHHADYLALIYRFTSDMHFSQPRPLGEIQAT